MLPKTQQKPGSIPIHCKAYAIPHSQRGVFLRETQHLINQGVIEKVGVTEHAYPTFIIPKKDGRVRWVSDFCKLNNMLIKKKYPLPHIQDMITKRPRYQYFTKIDISMQFYTFELDEISKNLCVIVTPFGKY